MNIPRLNRGQRIALIAAAIVIGIIQLMWFEENGIRGYGWVFSVIAIAVLVFLVLATEKADSSALPHSPTKQATASSNEGLKSYVAANIKAINALAEEVSNDLFGGASDVQTNRGALSDVMSSLGRSTLLLYSFALLVIGKIRHNPAYLSTDEHKKTKELTILQCLASDSRVLGEAAIKAPDAKLLNSFVAESALLEEGVLDFVRQIAKGNTSTPAEKINSWFKGRTGVASVSGKSLEEFTKSKLRSAYDMIYKLPA